MKNIDDVVPKAFWDKVNKTESCWIWTASVFRGPIQPGYGKYNIKRKTHSAHKFLWEAIHGKVPIKMHLDHLCRVRNCVNPAHLEIVTHKENILRGLSPSAFHAKKTHCINGHAFTDENTYRYKNRRQCKACRKITDSDRLESRRKYHRERYRRGRDV